MGQTGVKNNNWENLQKNPFNNEEKSQAFLEVRRNYLDKKSVDTSLFYNYLSQTSSLNRPKSLKALSDLVYIAFNRNGHPTIEEIEHIINTFKDDNSDFLLRYKELLINNKKIINDNFIPLENKEEKQRQVELQNAVLLLHLDIINSKLEKLNIEKLSPPKTVYENQDKGREITITENKGDILVMEKQIDKTLVGLRIWNKYDGRELSPDSFNGLCNSTAEACIRALRLIGVDAYPYYVSMTSKSPAGNSNIGHYVALVNLNNRLYVYDMPQTEFIKSAKTRGKLKYIRDYDPRFIELNPENLITFYGNTKSIAEKNIENIIGTRINQYSVAEYIEDTNLIIKKEKALNQ